MNFDVTKALKIANKVKTPLSLAGITIIVLYAIYRQILSLDIFENIGQDSTFILLQNILDKLFWLALISILLGVFSYLVTIILNRKLRSHSSRVTLIDASLDPKDSPYVQIEEEGKKKIKPKKFNKGEDG
jgi:hypothetical protein